MKALDCPTPAKAGYVSRREARQVARRSRLRAPLPEGRQLGAYLCSCGLFHIGGRSKWLRRDGSVAVSSMDGAR